MSIVLRDYQESASKVSLDFLNSKKSNIKPLVVSPTGTGKSIIIADVVSKFPNEEILVIQPNKELLLQNFEKYKLYGGKASIFSASLKSKEKSRVTFATPGSVVSAFNLFKDTSIILIDEAHLQSKSSGELGSFLKLFNKAKILGFTASPVLLTGDLQNGPMLKMLNKTRKSLYNKIIHITQIQDIFSKYWTPLEYEILKLSEEELEWNASKSEYDEDSMINYYEDNNLEEKIIHKINQSSDRKSILVFCPNIEKANQLKLKIKNSEVITSKTSPKERERIVSEFKSLKIRVVINVFILSVGFDHIDLDMLIDASPTASAVRWYQKWGRIVRPSTKSNGLIVDYSGGSKRFGKLEDLVFKESKEFGWGMFSKSILLTGIPISKIGEIREKTTEYPEWKYGKFKGQTLDKLPKWYILWVLDNFTFNRENNHLKELLKELS